jgi:hypothetical protein
VVEVTDAPFGTKSTVRLPDDNDIYTGRIASAGR